jgi:hypothetical protein
MEKEFIPYTLALDMKSIGFDEPCFGFYNNAEAIPYIKQDLTDELKLIYTGDFEAPTFSQCFRWFRENYGLYHSIGLDNSLENDVNCDYVIINHSQSISELETDFKCYEEAELECLKKLIEIVK